MNRTTVKRGIGAVILALVAAALLAFLLKDKAAQRQDVVEMALPGTDNGAQSGNYATRLPQLSTDNSGNGIVVAQAGQDDTFVESTAQPAATLVDEASIDAGAVIASAGAGAAAATAAAQKSVDFNVRPSQKASDEFRDLSTLDLVNNGNTQQAASPTTTDNAKADTQAAPENPPAAPKKDQGTVIASTPPKKVAPPAAKSQARLIDEKKPVQPKSAHTAKVITRKAPEPKKAPKPVAVKEVVAEAPATPAAAPAPIQEAKHGYALQLLATSSASRATDLKNVMAGEGYPTYITKTNQSGKLLYRVRIGQYKTRAAAAKVQAAMKRRYKKNPNVNRSAIVAR